MSTHNIGFDGEIVKIISQLSLNLHLICPTVARSVKFKFVYISAYKRLNHTRFQHYADFNTYIASSIVGKV